MKTKCTSKKCENTNVKQGQCDQEWGMDATKNLSQLFLQSQGHSSKKPSFSFYMTTETSRLSSLHFKAPALSLSAWACQDWTQHLPQLCQIRLSCRALGLCAQPGRAPAFLGCGHSCLRVAKEEFGYLQQPSTHSVQPRRKGNLLLTSLCQHN